MSDKCELCESCGHVHTVENRCKWCGHVHGQQDIIPQPRDVVILYKPFFSHENGDIVAGIRKGDPSSKYMPTEYWIIRAGTSGMERTPINCIKTVIKKA